MRDRKLTVPACYRTGCDEKPIWAVKNLATSSIVKCCNEHLGATLHVSGLPAQVDPYTEDVTQKISLKER